jgi:hypothetical protein
MNRVRCDVFLVAVISCQICQEELDEIKKPVTRHKYLLGLLVEEGCLIYSFECFNGIKVLERARGLDRSW